MKVVIALGGNAIDRPGSRGEYSEQVENIRAACLGIADLISAGHQVVLTHGNGPQVGNLAIQQELGAQEVPSQPLHVLDAMTQGQIGYLLQRELANVLTTKGVRRQVVSVVTQVLVDRNDPAFRNPSKPIGPFYSKETAKKLEVERGYVVKKVSEEGEKQYRRVVPSPDPIGIVERETISGIVETSAIVIAAGGGGIPVIQESTGVITGVDAVIDKDLAAERLAEAVGADRLLILTNVEMVSIGFGRKNERKLETMNVSEASKYLARGEFPPGSMGPKVLACVRFVKWGGKAGSIGPLERAVDVLSGRAGTTITMD